MGPERITFEEEAVAEAERSRDWYAQRSLRASHEFLDELARAFEQIAAAPESWPPYLHGTRRFICHGYPFSVVYRVYADHVHVVAVAHAKRRPGYWSSRAEGARSE
jgi:plasmid stabilization system protein ParE